MKHILLLFVFFIGQGDVSAGGFSSWDDTTPGGNTLSYDDAYFYEGGIPYYTSLFCERVRNKDYKPLITNIMEWYYRPGYVIGTYALRPDSAGTSTDSVGYFIFEEATCALTTFSDKAAWDEMRSAKRLIPFLWKKSRTERDYAGFLGYRGGLYFFYLFCAAVIIEFFNVVILAMSRFREWKQFVWITLVLVTVLLVGYWWHHWPYGL